MSDEEVCQEIGRRLRAERLRRQLTQSEMSELAGIPLRTYKRLEADGSGSIATFVAAVRAAGRLLGLQLLLPQPELPERRNPLTDIAKRRTARKKLKPNDNDLERNRLP
ncbi:hypothetical protein NCCP691_19000 [Noviherbaspirillum aridicola]|uniref:HTH cro/C1-type domain-containing protein n=1 Tax=Noviherbaspirillum aridicola TaxID=2849687 RepID=A0ABQ4Q3V6_9BURK|nr:hypothetical protein NCCP691_19000 [Noviherbaspirillum aridicola]